MTSPLPLLREIRASALAQRLTSLVVGLIMMIATASVIATAGYAAGRQQQILSTIDDMDTRSLTIRTAQSDSPLTLGLANALAGYDIVAQTTAFSEVFDVSARTDSGAPRVSARRVYGRWATEREDRLDKSHPPVPVRAIASPGVLDRLGLAPSGGAVRTIDDGPEFQVVAEEALPEFLDDYAPTILIPTRADPTAPVASILIVADSAANLPFVERLVIDHLSGIPSSTYTLASSQQFAALRTALDGSLTSSNRTLILATLTIAAVSAMIVVWGTVLMRRKDFGRRRALGATRTTILVLTIGQVALASIVGAFLGTGAGLVLLLARDAPLPGGAFVCAGASALVLSSCTLAVLPAAWASARDPLHELRVP